MRGFKKKNTKKKIEKKKIGNERDKKIEKEKGKMEKEIEEGIEQMDKEVENGIEQIIEQKKRKVERNILADLMMPGNENAGPDGSYTSLEEARALIKDYEARGLLIQAAELATVCGLEDEFSALIKRADDMLDLVYGR